MVDLWWHDVDFSRAAPWGQLWLYAWGRRLPLTIADLQSLAVWAAPAACRAEHCLTLSLLQQGLSLPLVLHHTDCPEHPVARTAEQQSKARQRGGSINHWAFTRGKKLHQGRWYLVQYVLICFSAVTSTYCCSCREADTDANEMPSAICNSLSSAEQ